MSELVARLKVPEGEKDEKMKLKGRTCDHQSGGRLEYVTDNGSIAPANTVGLNLDGAPMPCIDITTQAGREFAYDWEYFRWIKTPLPRHHAKEGGKSLQSRRNRRLTDHNLKLDHNQVLG